MDEKQKLGFEVIHIGINQKDSSEAEKNADVLNDLFGFEKTETPISIFSSKKIEIMKKKGAGELGHIAIGTNDVAAAKKYLMTKGIEFDDSTATYTSDGKLKLVYLKNDIAGFAFHLVLK